MSRQISYREFLDKPEPYYVVDVNYEYWTDKISETCSDVLQEQATGWYYQGHGFFAFGNSVDCDLIKGVISWDSLQKTA
jgi:hypothetical protein